MDFILVGLGNPGSDYEYTRHNVGWRALDYIAKECGVKIKKIKFKATYAEAVIQGKKVLLLKPQTFMNLSGEAVMSAANYYNIPPERIIVIQDDIALPCAKLRIRRKGSDGGHNGLKNIIYLLNSDEFPRIKIGVSNKENGNLKDWVLGNFSKEDDKLIVSRFPDVLKAVELIVNDNTEQAMALFN